MKHPSLSAESGKSAAHIKIEMRILYLSRYYPPEIGATQTRAAEMAAGLVRVGHQVTVLAEMPDRPHGVMAPNIAAGSSRARRKKGSMWFTSGSRRHRSSAFARVWPFTLAT